MREIVFFHSSILTGEATKGATNDLNKGLFHFDVPERQHAQVLWAWKILN